MNGFVGFLTKKKWKTCSIFTAPYGHGGRKKNGEVSETMDDYYN